LLNRKAKGDLAELKVATDLVARGYKIALPYGEDWDYDLILCRGQSLERVQVKYACSDGQKIAIRCRSHSLTNGKVRRTKYYTRVLRPGGRAGRRDERDHIEVDCLAQRASPRDPARRELSNDLSPRTISCRGAIAQLGERSPCTRKVAGSNPAGSTYRPVEATRSTLTTTIAVNVDR
jgi:PD-(D/E)XK endonuclease